MVVRQTSLRVAALKGIPAQPKLNSGLGAERRWIACSVTGVLAWREQLQGTARTAAGAAFGWRRLADLLAAQSRDLHVGVDETGVTTVVHGKLGDAPLVSTQPVFRITTGPLRKSHNMSPSNSCRCHDRPSSMKFEASVPPLWSIRHASKRGLVVVYSPGSLFCNHWKKRRRSLFVANMEPERGIEPRTYALRVRCSAV